MALEYPAYLELPSFFPWNFAIHIENGIYMIENKVMEFMEYEPLRIREHGWLKRYNTGNYFYNEWSQLANTDNITMDGRVYRIMKKRCTKFVFLDYRNKAKKIWKTAKLPDDDGKTVTLPPIKFEVYKPDKVYQNFTEYAPNT